MTPVPDPGSSRRTARRGVRGTYGPLALGVAGVTLAVTALVGCSSNGDADDADDTADDSPVRTQSPTPSDAPIEDDPGEEMTRKRLKGFYEEYLTALDGPPSEPKELRKTRLSVHYLEDLADKEKGVNRGDALTQSANIPHGVGKVSHDSTIDNHRWFFVELTWKDGKVPTEDSGAPDEPEYAPTKVRVQVDRDTQKISDVEAYEREPGPGQPKEPNTE